MGGEYTVLEFWKIRGVSRIYPHLSEDWSGIGIVFLYFSTTGIYGTHKQWVMSDSIDALYIFFETGIMTSLQQSR